MKTKNPKTSQIMESLASWEKKRLSQKAAWVLPIIAIGGVIIWMTVPTLASDLDDLGFSDLFTALTDDFSEFKNEFTQNLSLIWNLLPQDILVISLLAIFLVIVVLVLNRNDISSFPRRLSSIRKYLSQKGGDHK